MPLDKRSQHDLLLTGIVAVMTSYWMVDLLLDRYFPRFGEGRLIFDGLFVMTQLGVIGIVWTALKRRRQLQEALTGERQQAEEERNRTDAILAAIGEGISIQDRAFRVIYQNEAHKQLVGRDCHGELCFAAYSASAQVCDGCPVVQTFADGLSHLQEKRLVNSDEERYIEIFSYPLRDRHGVVVAGIETVRDVTHRWKANQRIQTLNQALQQQSEELTAANRELESFNYSLSHDLRSPLTQIETAIDLLAQNIEQSSLNTGDNAFFVKTIRNGGERMDQMIQGMLDLARVGRGEICREWIDLSSMAGVIVEELQQRDPVRQVAVTIAPEMIANADPRLSRIVLQNLIENAWKYTIQVENAEIEIGSFLDGERRFFFVRDNGAGFNPVFVSRIFMPFQRLHEASEFRGDGIGLSTVHRIIQRHGGVIFAEGEVGKGATFTFGFEPDPAPQDH